MIPKIDHYEAVRPDSIQTITLDGEEVLAFTVRPGDVQPWDSGNIGPNGQPNERAEVSYAAAPSGKKGDSPYDVREGMLQTYDNDYRFEPGFPRHVAANHEWAMLLNIHPQDDGHKPGAVGGFSGVSVHDGQITLSVPNLDGAYFATEPIVPDHWYRRRLVVKWSATDGYVKWIDRDNGELLGHFEGQTISAGEFKYIKQGYYRAGGLPQATVYQKPIDISDGDLSLTAPVAPPVQPPVAPSGNAEARRLLLVQQNETVFPALQSQADALVASAQLIASAVKKAWDDVVSVLNKGP